MDSQLTAALQSFALDHSSLSGSPQPQPNCSSGIQRNLEMWLHPEKGLHKSDTSSPRASSPRAPGESHSLHSWSRNTNTCFHSSDQHGASATRGKPRRVSLSSCCHHKTSSPAVHMATKQSPSHTTPSALTNVFCR